MPRKNITFGLTEETYTRLAGLLPAPIGTSSNMDTLLDALERISALSEENAALSERTAALTEENAALSARISALSEENASLQETAAALSWRGARLPENRPMPAGETESPDPRLLTIEMNPHVQSLLRETASRLSARYGTTVTPDDLLTKIFLRYTVERLTLWFYPFVLTDRDITAITGRTPADWRRFLSGSGLHSPAPSAETQP